MAIVHHHLIYQAKVGRKDLGEGAEAKLRDFTYELLKEIGMQELIPAQFKFSDQKAWTGLMGIITSHISFHYWTKEQYVQLDIYSCKSFDKQKAIEFLNKFWLATETRYLFINREPDKDFEIEKNLIKIASVLLEIFINQINFRLERI